MENSIMTGLMEFLAYSEEWNQIEDTDSCIAEARAAWNKVLSSLPEEIKADAENTVDRLTEAYLQPAMLFGMRVYSAVQKNIAR